VRGMNLALQVSNRHLQGRDLFLIIPALFDIGLHTGFEKAVKKLVRDTLEGEYGTRWIAEIPQPVYTAATT